MQATLFSQSSEFSSRMRLMSLINVTNSVEEEIWIRGTSSKERMNNSSSAAPAGFIVDEAFTLQAGPEKAVRLVVDDDMDAGIFVAIYTHNNRADEEIARKFSDVSTSNSFRWRVKVSVVKFK